MTRRPEDPMGFMGGFLMGNLLAESFAGQSTLFTFVTLRFDPDLAFLPILEETIKDTFYDNPSKVIIELEFTEKAELKVWSKPKKRRDKPALLFTMCYFHLFKKDAFFSIAIRNEIRAPITLHITLLRNLLINLKDKKIKYEVW